MPVRVRPWLPATRLRLLVGIELKPPSLATACEAIAGPAGWVRAEPGPTHVLPRFERD